MSRERPGRPRARMFIALDLPQRTRQMLSTWASEMIELRPGELRIVPVDSLHVTLAFLGYRYLREVDRLTQSICAIAEQPVAVSFERALAPRPTRSPRLYAAAVTGNHELALLRSSLVADLERSKLFEDERRAFWPHVTLCRVRSSVRHHRVIEHLPGAAPALRAAVAAPSITLFRSELRPEGAQYTPLFTAELSAPAGA